MQEECDGALDDGERSNKTRNFTSRRGDLVCFRILARSEMQAEE